VTVVKFDDGGLLIDGDDLALACPVMVPGVSDSYGGQPSKHSVRTALIRTEVRRYTTEVRRDARQTAEVAGSGGRCRTPRAIAS
jgi:hypothetical protein